jgi:hypothetical protein
LPLAVAISAGNANEQRFLLPLVDQLRADRLRPRQVWADRGYWSSDIRTGLRDRRISARISRRRNPGEPIPEGTPTRTSDRGRRKRTKPLDPLGRHRWQIERTNAWLHNYPRLHTRRDVKVANYQAFFTIAMSLVLARKL